MKERLAHVLSQEQEGKWRPVSFLSKSLSVTERNYEIYNKELLAIMLALEEWRHYLMGAYQDFENLDGPSKPPIFPETSESEPTTSPMDHRISRISFYPPS